MHLSAPIYRLKRKARLLARTSGCPLHAALDSVALEEGFRSWSHLASRSSRSGPAVQLMSRFDPGDMVLLGARPGHGKTLLGLELAVRAGRGGFFFTLEYNRAEVAAHLLDLGIARSSGARALTIDTSDDLSAKHIERCLEQVTCPAVVVIDYLQVLDQKRAHPDLETQVRCLRRMARQKDAICIALSQIDRAFETSDKPMPGLTDVRLPNPLDLGLFDKACFLHDGALRIDAAA